MRLVILAAAVDDPLRKLLNRAAAAAIDDCIVVRTRPGWGEATARLRVLARKTRRRGATWLVPKLLHLSTERALRREFESRLARTLARHHLSARDFACREIFVDDINGASAIEILRNLRPDIALQNGAGLLSARILSIPRLGTLNVHHGVLPRIRGGDSIFWALAEGRPDWVGCTVHLIDERLDRGTIVARKEVGFRYGEHPSDIYARITFDAVRLLEAVLQKTLSTGQVPKSPIQGRERSAYRSFAHGGTLAALWANGFRPLDLSE